MCKRGFVERCCFYYLSVSGDWKNEKFKGSFLKCKLVADGLTGAPEKGKPDKPAQVYHNLTAMNIRTGFIYILDTSSNSFTFLSSKFASSSICN